MPEQEYTEDQVHANFENIRFSWEEPDGELEEAILAVYRMPTVNEDESVVEAVIAFMMEHEGPTYTPELIRAYGDRYKISYKDANELAEEDLRNVIGEEIVRFFTYIDLDRLGGDLVSDDATHYFEHGGRIHYFGSEA